MEIELDQEGGVTMKREAMERKWKDNRGETLIEVLASILVGTLSVALLFSAVMASVKMDRTAQKADTEFRESLNGAEEQKAVVTDIFKGETVTQATVTIKNKSSGMEKTLNVEFYGGEQILSYKLK